MRSSHSEGSLWWLRPHGVGSGPEVWCRAHRWGMAQHGERPCCGGLQNVYMLWVQAMALQ